jgi:hypothetical protein
VDTTVREFTVEPALLGTPRSAVVECLGKPDEHRIQGPHEIEIYQWRAVPGRRLLRGSSTHLRVDGRSLPIADGTRLMLQYSRNGLVTGYAVSAHAP